MQFSMQACHSREASGYYQGVMGPAGNGVVPLTISPLSFTNVVGMPNRVILEIHRGERKYQSVPSLQQGGIQGEAMYTWDERGEIQFPVRLLRSETGFSEKVVLIKVVDADDRSHCLLEQYCNLCSSLSPTCHSHNPMSLTVESRCAAMTMKLCIETSEAIEQQQVFMRQFVESHGFVDQLEEVVRRMTLPCQAVLEEGERSDAGSPRQWTSLC